MRHLIASYRTLSVMTGCITAKKKQLPLIYIRTYVLLDQMMELVNCKLLVA